MFSLLAVITTLFCSLLVGALPALWRVLPGAVAERLGQSTGALDFWRKGYLLILVAAFPVVGRLVDAEGGQWYLFMGLLAAILGLAWLGLAQTWRGALAAIVLLALGNAGLTITTTVLMRKTFEDAGLPAVAGLNLGFVAAGLGTLLTPRLVRLFLDSLGYRKGWLVLGLLGLIPAGLVALTSPGYFPQAHQPRPLAEFFADPRWWLLGALSFLYFPLEHLLEAWRLKFLQQHPSIAGLAGLGYWFGFLGMRAAIGWIIWDQYEAWGLVCLALAYVVIEGNLASAQAPHSGRIGLTLIGGSFGPLLPTLLAAVSHLDTRNEAQLMGLVYGVGSLSGLLLEPLLNRFAERRETTSTMWLSLYLTLVWGALALLLAMLGYLGVL